MIEVTHPQADRDCPVPAAATAPDGQTYELVDGSVSVPADVADALADAWADQYAVDAADLLPSDGADDSDDTDGCPFCDEYDGDNPGIHAAQAHPEQWADYQED